MGRTRAAAQPWQEREGPENPVPHGMGGRQAGMNVQTEGDLAYSRGMKS
ncbi:hypothetical protein DAI22_09g107100 [Oryza sativa Japonica Group]|nr:hypothetical protein DAI22_09g107100 [Oryza sativa Japonica Group]